MNKKIILAIVALILLVLVFFGSKGKKTDETQTTKTTEKTAVTNVETSESDFKGNLMDLFKAGKNMKCTYSNTTDEFSISGTTYIAGNKMRMDATTTMEDKTSIESHMVSDGTWMYSWSAAMPQGIKMKIDTQLTESQTNPDTTNNTDNYAKTFQEDYDFKCTNWNADNGKFEIPANITFTDFSEMTKPTVQNGQNNACSACNYMQDADAKAQCMSALGCK